jgi:hypothetical protein
MGLIDEQLLAILKDGNSRVQQIQVEVEFFQQPFGLHLACLEPHSMQQGQEQVFTSKLRQNLKIGIKTLQDQFRDKSARARRNRV